MPALLCAIMGLLGIVLASAGLFGVVLHRVNRAARETAVRMALGARVGTIMGSVLRNGLALAGIGAGIGLAGSLAVGRLMANLLHSVQPHDPLVLLAGVLVVLVAAALASLYPAWRATRVDPAAVLRAE